MPQHRTSQHICSTHSFVPATMCKTKAITQVATAPPSHGAMRSGACVAPSVTPQTSSHPICRLQSPRPIQRVALLCRSAYGNLLLFPNTWLAASHHSHKTGSTACHSFNSVSSLPLQPVPNAAQDCRKAKASGWNICGCSLSTSFIQGGRRAKSPVCSCFKVKPEVHEVNDITP